MEKNDDRYLVEQNKEFLTIYNTFQIQSNLDFRTSRSSNNLVFEQKIRDENRLVLEQIEDKINLYQRETEV